MIYYLDTSLLVAAFTAEGRTAAAQNWLEAHSLTTLAVRAWLETEFCRALSKKMREGKLTVAQRSQTTAAWHRFREAATAPLAIASQDFETAARFVERHTLGLRAGDAWHLAVAARHGATLVTLDRTMATAATSCGVPLAEIFA